MSSNLNHINATNPENFTLGGTTTSQPLANALLRAAPATLLPARPWRQNPLFLILAVLAFLASLSIFALQSSLSARSQWGASLTQTASLHIKPTITTAADTQGFQIDTAQIEATQSILAQYPQIDYVQRIPTQQTHALLAHWLGDTPLPSDLPIPIILHIQLHPNSSLPVTSINEALTKAGIDADIDNHNHWAAALDKKMRALELVFFLVFILVFFAILAASNFAVQAALSRRQKMMEVLQQIGAPARFTTILFAKRFALTSFKAGLTGAAGAFILLFILGFVFDQARGQYSDADLHLLPNITSPFDHIFVVLIVPIVMAIITVFVCWRQIKDRVYKKMYS